MPVGPTARDLADALVAQPVLKVTRPKPASAEGTPSAVVEVTLPASFDSRDCQTGGVALFSWAPRLHDWWELEADGVVSFSILDVYGQRWAMTF